jgi:predicted RNase H-like HicB family nuclease
MKIKIVLEPQKEGGFTAYVPSLLGCISEGDIKEEVLKNIKGAIELYLETGSSEIKHSKDDQIVELTV